MKNLKYLLYSIIVLTGAIIWGLAFWASSNFDVNVSAILNTLLTPLEGTSRETILPAVLACLPWIVAAVASMVLFVFSEHRKPSAKKLVTRGFFLGAILFVMASFVFIQCKYDLIGYVQKTRAETNLYAEKYVDPREVEITAPEKKRNLIYIYLESMETTYADQENGGRQKHNYIPNLTQLAGENISFAPNDSLGGFYACEGGGWTMGALFATMSGVPFELPVGDNDMNLHETFASGLYTMGDFLKEQGYRQMFLCGSDGMFAGRKTFFEQHGEYEVYDYYKAIEEGEIAPDYKVWWGFEDAKLYEIAKKQLSQMALQGEPFNFTMLTVDTHHRYGYVCQLCDDQYKNVTANVVACADQQAYEFINWIKQQDFYENTTLVISGDHPRMDKFLVRDVPYNDRLIYNCFLNTPFDAQQVIQKREFSSLDIFPTVLAAMGYEIEGERLGLGTNLFSHEKTLVEEMGIEELNLELMKTSEFYMEHFAPELTYLIEDEFEAIHTVYFYGEQYNADQYVSSDYQILKDAYWVKDKLEVDIPLKHEDGDVSIKLHIKEIYNEKQRIWVMEDNSIAEEQIAVPGNTVISITGHVKDGHCRFSITLPDAVSPHELNSDSKDDVKRSFSLSSITVNEQE